ncbi:hypothetical protein UFOVP1475_10 [uncultured Caudovirales phage]|uniref:Uncharacterized protein n=1 Tax=uncultured Caudovirales phage TaxID=2100421 RepID=A0A6J5SMZ3_9CAUD|nr:hypothetical protein UFOVP1475_10 [uncultured Caudovirales phage]
MKLKILTREESLELARKNKEERLGWTLEQIVQDATFFRNLPDGGNTKYIIGEENWNNFFNWLTTSEARMRWNETTSIVDLARYFTENKI